MKRLVILLALAATPALGLAQTYTVKLFTDVPSYKIAEEPQNNIYVYDIGVPNAVSQKTFEKFLTENPKMTTFSASRFLTSEFSSSIKRIDNDSGDTEEKQSSVSFFTDIVKGLENTMECQFSMSKNLKISHKGKILKEEGQNIKLKQYVKLGVPTIIHEYDDIRIVRDQVPFWGNIPLLGKLFQSTGECRQIYYTVIVITENKN